MVPLYTDPVRVARMNDEIPQYRESKRANIACKKAIENLLAERFDGMRFMGTARRNYAMSSESIASDGFSRVQFSTFRGMAGSDTTTSSGRTSS